jgi:hypothetical protein
MPHASPGSQWISRGSSISSTGGGAEAHDERITTEMTIIDDRMGDLPSEEWRPMPGWEGIYSISDMGRHCRVGRASGATVGEILKPHDGGKTLRITLRAPGRYETAGLARMVLRAFSGPPPFPDAVARHKDGDVFNNRIGNLEWGSQKKNKEDQRSHLQEMRFAVLRMEAMVKALCDRAGVSPHA